MRDAEIKALTLQIEEYCYSMLVDDGWTDPSVKAHFAHRIESLATQLTATFKAPVQVLQNDRVIATYPSTWWDHVKSQLGWKHRRETVRLTEHLLYPTVSIPDPFKPTVKLYIQSRITPMMFCDDQAIGDDE